MSDDFVSGCDLHIPHKDWAATTDLDKTAQQLELENLLEIERWAQRLIRECLPSGGCSEGFMFQFDDTTILTGGAGTPLNYVTFGTAGRYGFLNTTPSQWKSSGVSQGSIPVFGYPGILIPAGVWSISVNLAVDYSVVPTSGHIDLGQWTYNGPVGPPGGAQQLTYFDIANGSNNISVSMTGIYYDNPTWITAYAANSTDQSLTVSGSIQGVAHTPCSPTIDEGELEL